MTHLCRGVYSPALSGGAVNGVKAGVEGDILYIYYTTRCECDKWACSPKYHTSRWTRRGRYSKELETAYPTHTWWYIMSPLRDSIPFKQRGAKSPNACLLFPFRILCVWKRVRLNGGALCVVWCVPGGLSCSRPPS